MAVPITIQRDATTAPVRQVSRASGWGAVFALTLCVATLIASEFMPVGLLTPLATDLYTYLRPFLETVTRVDVSTLSLLLLLTGGAGLLGTWLIGMVLRYPAGHRARGNDRRYRRRRQRLPEHLRGGSCRALCVGDHRRLERFAAAREGAVSAFTTSTGKLDDRRWSGARHALRLTMHIKTPIVAALLALVTAACGPQSGEPESAAPAATASASSAAPSEDSLVLTRASSRRVDAGPAEWFSGTARIEPLFAATDSSRAAGASVSFEPGARTAWHRHPRGQVLVVTDGIGLVQQRGGSVEEIRAGDVIWTPPGVEHWHGATPTTTMTHIAIHEHVGGNVVTWLEKVSDAQYDPPPRAFR